LILLYKYNKRYDRNNKIFLLIIMPKEIVDVKKFLNLAKGEEKKGANT
jgi:hypothetical protein